MKIYYMTTNNTLATTGSLTVSSSDLSWGSYNPYYYSNSSSGITFNTSYSTTSGFPALIKTEEVEEGSQYLFAVPGCGKENVSVTYLEQDSFFKVEANCEIISKYPLSHKIQVNTSKFDLSKIECSIKNGLLKVLVPYKKDAIPKAVKIS